MNALAGDHIDVKTPLSEMTTLKRSSVNKKSKSEDTKVVLPVKHARKYLTWGFILFDRLMLHIIRMTSRNVVWI